MQLLRFISCVYTLHPGYPRNRCIFFVDFNDKSLWIWSSFYYLKIFHKYSLQQIEFLAFSNFIVIERQKCAIYIDTKKNVHKTTLPLLVVIVSSLATGSPSLLRHNDLTLMNIALNSFLKFSLRKPYRMGFVQALSIPKISVDECLKK